MIVNICHCFIHLQDNYNAVFEKATTNYKPYCPMKGKSKAVLDYGFHAVYFGFQVLDSGFHVTGTWIPDSNL